MGLAFKKFRNLEGLAATIDELERLNCAVDGGRFLNCEILIVSRHNCERRSGLFIVDVSNPRAGGVRIKALGLMGFLRGSSCAKHDRETEGNDPGRLDRKLERP